MEASDGVGAMGLLCGMPFMRSCAPDIKLVCSAGGLMALDDTSGRWQVCVVSRPPRQHARLPPGGVQVQRWRACAHTPSRVAPTRGASTSCTRKTAPLTSLPRQAHSTDPVHMRKETRGGVQSERKGSSAGVAETCSKSRAASIEAASSESRCRFHATRRTIRFHAHQPNVFFFQPFAFIVVASHTPLRPTDSPQIPCFLSR